ncbi:hypothetical protein N8920_04320 [Opitutales bacterium]|nr:hypothetical protein [Opitutales bacterium]
MLKFLQLALIPFDRTKFCSSKIIHFILGIIGFQLGIIAFNANAAVRQIVIHCSTQTTNNNPNILFDSNNNPLSSGVARNGDGYLVTLGYYNQATSDSPSNHFNGDWVPLTEGTRIGDSSTGYGFNDGMFSFTSTFTEGSDIVNIFPFEPAFFQLTSPHAISSSLPAPGTPLCIKFYDSAELSASTKYNAVTGTDWLWPSFSSGIPVNYYFKISNGIPPPNSKWKYGKTLKYNAPTFQTTELIDFVPDLYNLIISHNAGGTVNDVNASYPDESSVELIATPDPHMEFVGWIGDGVSDPLFPSTVVFMTEDRNVTAVFQPKLYELKIVSSGVGNLIGSGEYSFGEQVNITATPSLGFEFSYWEGFGIDNNLTATTSIQISQDQQIKAVFMPKQQVFTALSENASFGTVQIIQSGPYRNGTIYDIFAQPNLGYTFSHWSSTNNALYMLDSNMSASTKVNLSDDALLFAHFTETKHKLEILLGAGGESVSPATSNYGIHEIVAINATPLTGYEFTKWHDPAGIVVDPYVSSTDVNMSLTTGDHSILANFTRKFYDINITEGTGGNVILDTPNGPWNHFGTYTITALPHPGYKFVSWNGNQISIESLVQGNQQPSNQISLTSNVSLHAHFTPEEYFISVSSGNGGTASGGGQYSIENQPELSATHSPGWEFSHWDGNESYLVYLSSVSSPKVLVNLTEAPPSMTFEAVFKRPSFVLSLQASEGGTVNGQNNFEMDVESGSEVTLSAQPNIGWSFDRWFGTEEDSIKNPDVSILITSDTSIESIFKKKSYNLGLTQTTDGESSGAGFYEFADSVEIIAVPKDGFVFEKWIGDIEYIDSNLNAKTYVKIPDSNITLTPVFSIIPINITVNVSGTGHVSGAGAKDPREPFALAAIGGAPSNSSPRGHDLLKWSWSDDQGTLLTSTDNPLTLSSTTDLVLNAEFYAIPPDEVDVKIISSPSSGGIIFDDPNQRVWNIDTDKIDRNVSVISQTGYFFKGWTITPSANLSPNWRSPNISTDPIANSNLTAHLQRLTHKFKVVYDQTRGSVSSHDSKYFHTEKLNITAIPNVHYEFDKWNLEKDNEYEITVGVSTINPQAKSLFIDGLEGLRISLVRGFTYQFDVNLDSNEKFYISERLFEQTPFSHEYLSGITNSRVEQGILQFTVSTSSPDRLYYHSSNAQSHGGVIDIVDLPIDDVIAFPSESSITPTFTTDLKLKASFKPKEYSINVTASSGGSVESISDTFNHNEKVSLIATANEHFDFVRWEGSLHIENPNAPSTRLSVHEATNIKAFFTAKLYPLSISSEPKNTASFTTTNNLLAFPFGTVVEVEAFPLSGYKFKRWEGNVLETSKSSTKITISESNQIIAEIATEPLSIEVVAETLNYKGEGNASMTGGVFSGASIVQSNEKETYVAIPNEGFEFIGWFDGLGNALSNQPKSELIFTKNSTLYAKFKEKSYRLDIMVSPQYLGTLYWEDLISLDDLSYTLPHDYLVQLKAEPLENNLFQSWELFTSADPEMNANEISFKIKENTFLTANFSPPLSPSLSIDVIPAGAGIVVGNGAKSQSGKHYIFATSNPGYSFKKWEGPGISDTLSSDTTIDFDKNTTIRAVFDRTSEPPSTDGNNDTEFVLEVTPSNKNHGNTNPIGKNIYAKGLIPILAKPKLGYVFSHWNGEGVTDKYAESTSVQLDKNILLAAIFEPTSNQQKYVKVEKSILTFDYLGEKELKTETGGSIIGGTSFAVGYEPTFKIYTKEGYEFLRWENSIRQPLSTSSEITFDSEYDFSLVAVFKKKSYSLQVLSQPDGKGLIKWHGEGSSSSHIDLLPHGQTLSFSAYDHLDYKFLNWTTTGTNIDDPSEPNLNFVIKSDLYITANYYPLVKVKLTIESTPAAGGWIIGGGEFAYNSNHLLHAKPNPGYKFLRWEGNQINDRISAQTKINLDQDLSVAAIFEPDLTYIGNDPEYDPGLHSLQIKTNNETQGKTSGSGVYGTGWVVIEALPKTNYAFSHWEGNNIFDKKSARTEILVDHDSTATAYFEEKLLFSDSLSNSSGWNESSWFGVYWNKHPEKWAFHNRLGWVYAHEIGLSSYWVWMSRLDGWYWIEKTTFPYMYDSNTKTWVYLSYQSEGNGVILFKFSENAWRRIE